MGTGLRSPVGGASRRLWRLLAASTALIVGLVLLALAGCGTGSSGASHQSGARLQAEHAYGRLPLAFVPNRGQLDARALYVARGAGYSLFLTKRSAVLSLAGGKAGQKPSRSAALALGFVGANPAAQVQAESGLPGTVNYLIGRDRARWHTNIPTYGRVGYRNLWPGIDAVFYGNQGRLEYDFDVAPGADTRRIGLSLAGATRIRPLQSGALLIELP